MELVDLLSVQPILICTEEKLGSQSAKEIVFLLFTFVANNSSHCLTIQIDRVRSTRIVQSNNNRRETKIANI